MSTSHPTEPLSQLSLVDLIDHIEATHHAYIRETAPLLIEYTEKLVRAHGEDHDLSIATVTK